MLVDLHMLQNFAPSNLNRDDTGSPKDCEFGGYRRARLSSQCQKRAMRQTFSANGLLPPEHRAVRTARLTDAIADRLVAKGHDAEAARRVVEAAVPGTGLKLKEGRTEYLLFLGADELDSIADICYTHWDLLAAAVVDSKASKKEAKAALPREVAEALNRALDGRAAADLALFGRMLADLPARNRDAASQVAHALSTNAVSTEFDFFTAVDDLKPASEDAGAGMLGTIEFNSPCYYRYATVDLGQLRENLNDDEELVQATLRAFLQAAVEAIPTGKQNTFAAHNPPSLIMSVVRDRGPRSLTNAFVKPIAPRGDSDLIAGSIAALDDYWGRLATMYGDGGVIFQAVCLDPAYTSKLANLASRQVSNVGMLIERTLSAVASGAQAG
jgi:CRISPR system Cascade subunit CasC